MPPPYHKLAFLAEDVMYEYLKKTVPGNVYRAADAVVSGEKLVSPYVAITSSHTAQEFADAPIADQASGNRIVTLDVEAVTTVDPETSGGVTVATARDRHATLIGTVEDALFCDNLVAQLNAQSIAGITVQHFTFGDTTTTPEKYKYKTTLEVNLHVFAVV